jgi:hypothetical protein
VLGVVGQGGEDAGPVVRRLGGEATGEHVVHDV